VAGSNIGTQYRVFETVSLCCGLVFVSIDIVVRFCISFLLALCASCTLKPFGY